MEPLEERTVAGLPPTMQMIYWTGAVAQRDVALEHTLAGVHARLAATAGKQPEGVSNLVKAIRCLLEAGSIIDSDLNQLALALLVDIEKAHGTRNRLVHDLWWHSPSDDGKMFDQLLLRGHTPRGPSERHLNDFRACAAQLAICEFRTTALGVLLDDQPTPTTQHDDRASWRVALAGGVELTEGGGYRIIDESRA